MGVAINGAGTRMRKVMAGFGVAVGGIGLLAAPALAHVHVTPDTAAKGGDGTFAFSVPNEEDNANTTQVAIQFPTDHPIATVDVEPVPGWTYKVEMTHLSTPVKTDSGSVSDVVGVITWSGGSIKPGEFQRFTVAVDGLPADTDSLEFKTVQTYSNGDVSRWIEDTPKNGPAPEHPAPVLTLTSGDSSTPTTTAPGATTAKVTPTQTDVDHARDIGIVGIVVGAIGLVIGAAAFVAGSRKAGGS